MNKIKRGETSLDSPTTTLTHILLHKDGIGFMTTVGAQPVRRRDSDRCITGRIARDAEDQ